MPIVKAAMSHKKTTIGIFVFVVMLIAGNAKNVRDYGWQGYVNVYNNPPKYGRGYVRRLHWTAKYGRIRNL